MKIINNILGIYEGKCMNYTLIDGKTFAEKLLLEKNLAGQNVLEQRVLEKLLLEENFCWETKFCLENAGKTFCLKEPLLKNVGKHC